MLRTRDFLLFFSIISFLLFAIGGTLIMHWFERDAAARFPTFTPLDTSTEAYPAEVAATDTLARSERLADMRNKIAARGELISVPESVSVPDDSSVEATTTEVASSDSPTVQLCLGYQTFIGVWPANDVQMKVTGHTREWYTPVERQFYQTATSSVPDELFIDEVTRLTIALNPNEFGEYCLPGDVIGVANDGSLIRNAEVSLYGVFDHTVQVGYALDGVPIYGSGTQQRDDCGGVVVGGEYRYNIDPQQDVILNCFSAPPSSSLYR